MEIQRKIVLQQSGKERYIVRLNRRRIGEIVLANGKWYYFGKDYVSQKGYDTTDEAVEELIATTTIKRLKKPSDYPRLQFRISAERIKWFRSYAKHQRTSMSAIIKDYIDQLYQQSQSADK